jgi:hypothetical protein
MTLYHPIRRRPAAAGPGSHGSGRPDDERIVEVARANPTDGTHAWWPRWPAAGSGGR